MQLDKKIIRVIHMFNMVLIDEELVTGLETTYYWMYSDRNKN